MGSLALFFAVVRVAGRSLYLRWGQLLANGQGEGEIVGASCLLHFVIVLRV